MQSSTFQWSFFYYAYLRAMQEKDLVTVDPSILEDQTVKSNHHLFERIIANKELGVIQNLDVEKSKEQKANLYWVKFHIAAIRIDEKYLVKAEA
ncbi:hypothetical protein OCK74_27070 [Chitinophagaceae bacterium LB-8]|uniref:Uncharacterized protein n=1 Tax=Paraflavisolibacter caeni TaxID=2982496 RepID=A0A9X2Y0Q0_9BACT|nr:hypothetical protein [Paraflavisolibacter caeni]MCU7552810.1 hypothetical protein [Paraflavisolibacter caeni]